MYELNRIGMNRKPTRIRPRIYEKISRKFTVSVKIMSGNLLVLSEGNAIIGFYSLSVQGKETELELFYIDPDT